MLTIIRNAFIILNDQHSASFIINCLQEEQLLVALQQVETLQAEVESMRATITSLEGEVKELQGQLDQKSAQIDHLKKTNQEKQV